ncbi:hypothetical protein ACFQ07_12740 [Actinomadura adrarensis]|uniref:Uncharacterized protein n=1 Tax=Actinomadura adrarensis TaxID=1819600 RepID=A0ABW3CHM9_9ACTN
MPDTTPHTNTHQIARIADAAAVFFAEHGLTWANPATRQPYEPTSADIALTLLELVEMVNTLGPGGRVERGHLVVERPADSLKVTRVLLFLGELGGADEDGRPGGRGGHSQAVGGSRG